MSPSPATESSPQPLPHPLEQGFAPSWASEWGQDRHGVFVGIEVNGVLQRLRWIPPGSFLMGSPESEEGRYSDEGPQHRVTLTQGFWLGETPCTQAFWEAVGEENPSCFRSPTRPVEQVSWERVQKFLERLNAHFQGEEFRLPTEAEWEYACRAGTTTSTYAGEMEIRGENHGTLLRDIAWYGGNSGVGFELDNGDDSSDWPKKEFKHAKAGTRPVGQKLPNAWGLRDMLGNVWEWCLDWKAPYGAEEQVDPRGPEQGSARVLRGGAWRSLARLCRAARRNDWPPDSAYWYVGFRLARGQGASSRGARSHP